MNKFSERFPLTFQHMELNFSALPNIFRNAGLPEEKVSGAIDNVVETVTDKLEQLINAASKPERDAIFESVDGSIKQRFLQAAHHIFVSMQPHSPSFDNEVNGAEHNL